MVTCPNCRAPDHLIDITSKKTEPGWGPKGPKDVTVSIRRKCNRCDHRWSTTPNKNWRWVYGSQIDRWVLVPPTDRDWKLWGVPQDDYARMNATERMATQTGGRMVSRTSKKKRSR